MSDSDYLPGEGGIVFVRNEDDRMQTAMLKARATLGYFRQSLRQPRPDQQSFSLKAMIEDQGHVEHIWLSEPGEDEDGLLYGTVNNHPQTVTNVRFGMRVGIDPDMVSDWMIVENGRLIGGYTIRAIRDQMDRGAQLDFDRSLGFVIDHGADHYPHDMRTPQGAILCLEDAYDANDLEAALACKDFRKEAQLMMARFPGLGPDEAIVASTAEALRLSFVKYMQDHGMPSFEGVDRAFPAMELFDENTVVVTEICTLPDGRHTMDRLWVLRHGDEWRVGPIYAPEHDA